MPTTIRLQKYLAERGVASRRRCAELIAAGRVRVNGSLVDAPGTRLYPGKDTVLLDGRPLSKRREPYRTILLHKPRGYICSANARQGKTVYDLIPGMGERLVPVGRLDKNSEGLLLMSNDGHFVNRLTHPRFLREKTYHVTVSGKIDASVLGTLRSRMVINGYRIQPVRARVVKENEASGRFVLEFILKEGRNRQIREMCAQVKLRIHRLVRVQVGPFTLAGLKPGQWRAVDVSHG